MEQSSKPVPMSLSCHINSRRLTFDDDNDGATNGIAHPAKSATNAMPNMLLLPFRDFDVLIW